MQQAGQGCEEQISKGTGSDQREGVIEWSPTRLCRILGGPHEVVGQYQVDFRHTRELWGEGETPILLIELLLELLVRLLDGRLRCLFIKSTASP